MATVRSRGCWAPPEISEGLRPIGGRRGSAGAWESERLEPGRVSGAREAEDVGSAGRAADAAAVCARAATIWVRSPAATIGGGSVSFWGGLSRPNPPSALCGGPSSGAHCPD